MANIVVKSKRFVYIPEDLKSLGVGALIAGAGAVLTFIAENISGVNFGEYTPFVVAGVSFLVNAVRKFISTSKYAK